MILENKYTTVLLDENSKVISVTNKKTKKDIRGEETYFFSLIGEDKKTVIIPKKVNFCDGIFTVITQVGDFKIRAEIFDEYFSFELITYLPQKAFKLRMAHIKYNYDYSDKENTGACGIPLTYWTNPCFYPDCKDLETKAEIVRHLKDEGGKYALIISPIKEQKEIIKKASLTIDKEKGLFSELGGAWGRDAKINFSNYILLYETSKEFIQENVDFFKSVGIDQLDFHKEPDCVYRQGDFKYARYENGAEFKKNVTDVLKERDMTAGLHTYSFYIDYACDTILPNPEYQKQIGTIGTYTLKCDIDENEQFIPTDESTAHISSDFGFMRRNTQFILVGEEIIKFENADNGFKVANRGWAGTKASAHKKGEKIYQLDGYYHGFAPVPGSDLYLQIARNIAKTYNEGGFSMIYLDALDGVYQHCDRDEEGWYYAALFTFEVLKHCNTTPLIEYATMRPSLWLARGRIGAYDYPFRSYRNFNKEHSDYNKQYIDRYSAPTMGWFWFYPETDEYPGNEHTKYLHTDQVEFMGALGLMYNYSIVYCELDTLEKFKTKKGNQRNLAIYKKYDDLRKAEYFSDEYLEKLRNGKWEYHLKEEDGKYFFSEKDVQTKKLYNLDNEKMNKAHFSNPFKAQTPFVRIEAFMSSDETNPYTLLKLDKNKDILSQKLENSFGGEIDLSDRIAKKVSIFGNGKKGAIAIKLRSATNSIECYEEFVIDIDFEGWRDFVLLECDNGERRELPFDNSEHFYSIYRSGFHHHRVTSIEVETWGDVDDVKMSDIEAVTHKYEVFKNPTVKIGDTKVRFECELMSTDFIEFDGKVAKVIDRYTNEKEIYFEGNIEAPNGDFEMEVTAKSLNNNILRAQATCIFTGEDVK